MSHKATYLYLNMCLLMRQRSLHRFALEMCSWEAPLAAATCISVIAGMCFRARISKSTLASFEPIPVVLFIYYGPIRTTATSWNFLEIASKVFGSTLEGHKMLLFVLFSDYFCSV